MKKQKENEELIDKMYQKMTQQKKEIEKKHEKERQPKTEEELEIERIRNKQFIPMLINDLVQFEALKSRDLQDLLAEKFNRQFFTYEQIERQGGLNDAQDISRLDKLLNSIYIENTPTLLLFCLNNSRIFGVTFDKQLERTRETFKISNKSNAELFSIEINGNTLDIERFNFNKSVNYFTFYRSENSQIICEIKGVGKAFKTTFWEDYSENDTKRFVQILDTPKSISGEDKTKWVAKIIALRYRENATPVNKKLVTFDIKKALTWKEVIEKEEIQYDDGYLGRHSLFPPTSHIHNSFDDEFRENAQRALTTLRSSEISSIFCEIFGLERYWIDLLNVKSKYFKEEELEEVVKGLNSEVPRMILLVLENKRIVAFGSHFPIDEDDDNLYCEFTKEDLPFSLRQPQNIPNMTIFIDDDGELQIMKYPSVLKQNTYVRYGKEYEEDISILEVDEVGYITEDSYWVDDPYLMDCIPNYLFDEDKGTKIISVFSYIFTDQFGDYVPRRLGNLMISMMYTFDDHNKRELRRAKGIINRRKNREEMIKKQIEIEEKKKKEEEEKIKKEQERLQRIEEQRRRNEIEKEKQKLREEKELKEKQEREYLEREQQFISEISEAIPLIETKQVIGYAVQEIFKLDNYEMLYHSHYLKGFMNVQQQLKDILEKKANCMMFIKLKSNKIIGFCFAKKIPERNKEERIIIEKDSQHKLLVIELNKKLNVISCPNKQTTKEIMRIGNENDDYIVQFDKMMMINKHCYLQQQNEDCLKQKYGNISGFVDLIGISQTNHTEMIEEILIYSACGNGNKNENKFIKKCTELKLYEIEKKQTKISNGKSTNKSNEKVTEIKVKDYIPQIVEISALTKIQMSKEYQEIILCYFKHQPYAGINFDSKEKLSDKIQSLQIEHKDFVYVMMTEMGKFVVVCCKFDDKTKEKDYMFMLISITTQGLDVEIMSKETSNLLKEIFENEYAKEKKEIKFDEEKQKEIQRILGKTLQFEFRIVSVQLFSDEKIENHKQYESLLSKIQTWNEIKSEEDKKLLDSKMINPIFNNVTTFNYNVISSKEVMDVVMKDIEKEYIQIQMVYQYLLTIEKKELQLIDKMIESKECFTLFLGLQNGRVIGIRFDGKNIISTSNGICYSYPTNSYHCDIHIEDKEMKITPFDFIREQLQINYNGIEKDVVIDIPFIGKLTKEGRWIDYYQVLHGLSKNIIDIKTGKKVVMFTIVKYLENYQISNDTHIVCFRRDEFVNRKEKNEIELKRQEEIKKNVETKKIWLEQNIDELTINEYYSEIINELVKCEKLGDEHFKEGIEKNQLIEKVKLLKEERKRNELKEILEMLIKQNEFNERERQRIEEEKRIEKEKEELERKRKEEEERKKIEELEKERLRKEKERIAKEKEEEERKRQEELERKKKEEEERLRKEKEELERKRKEEERKRQEEERIAKEKEEELERKRKEEEEKLKSSNQSSTGFKFKFNYDSSSFKRKSKPSNDQETEKVKKEEENKKEEMTKQQFVMQPKFNYSCYSFIRPRRLNEQEKEELERKIKEERKRKEEEAKSIQLKFNLNATEFKRKTKPSNNQEMEKEKKELDRKQLLEDMKMKKKAKEEERKRIEEEEERMKPKPYSIHKLIEISTTMNENIYDQNVEQMRAKLNKIKQQQKDQMIENEITTKQISQRKEDLKEKERLQKERLLKEQEKEKIRQQKFEERKRKRIEKRQQKEELKRIEQEKEKKKWIDVNEIQSIYQKDSIKCKWIIKQLVETQQKSFVQFLFDSSQFNLTTETFWKSIENEKEVFIVIEMNDGNIMGWFISEIPSLENNKVELEYDEKHFFFYFISKSKQFKKISRKNINESVFSYELNENKTFFKWNGIFQMKTTKTIHIEEWNKFMSFYKNNEKDINQIISFNENNIASFNRIVIFTVNNPELNNVHQKTKEEVNEKIESKESNEIVEIKEIKDVNESKERNELKENIIQITSQQISKTNDEIEQKQRELEEIEKQIAKLKNEHQMNQEHSSPNHYSSENNSFNNENTIFRRQISPKVNENKGTSYSPSPRIIEIQKEYQTEEEIRNAKIQKMKEERKKKKQESEAFFNFIPTVETLSTELYSSTKTIQIVKVDEVIQLNCIIPIGDKILMSIGNSNNLKQMIEIIESKEMKEIYCWKRNKELYSLKNEYFMNEKIFIGIETKRMNVFGFLLIKDKESQKYKQITFVSLINPQKLGIQLLEKKETDEFIEFNEDKKGFIEFKNIMMIQNNQIIRNKYFKSQFKSCQFDLDFYAEFGNETAIELKSIRIYKFN